jgi:hypothetical protein
LFAKKVGELGWDRPFALLRKPELKTSVVVEIRDKYPLGGWGWGFAISRRKPELEVK